MPTTVTRTARAIAVASIGLLATSSLAQSVLRQGASRDWTLSYRVNIRAWQDFGNQEQQRGASHDRWEFEQATVVVPWLERTSLSRTNQPHEISVKVDDRDAVPARTNPEIVLTGRHAGSRYLGFAIGKSTARELTVNATMSITAYDVTLDDERAAAIEWPAGDWPADAMSALEPQVGIEFGLDGEPYEGLDRVGDSIDRLISRLGTDPRNVPPYLVAKYLTGAIWAHIRSQDGSGLTTARTGEIEGIDVSGVPTTFVRRRGNAFEVAALLTYTMRRAGLPARMVMGQVADSRFDQEDVLTRDRGKEGEFIAWVEFAMVERGRTTWVPVDINGMMERSSRAPDINDVETLREPWEGFGTIKDSQYWAPFAFHVHPPLTVKAYNAPGFWGIFAEPAEPGRAEQMMSINVTTTPVTAETRRQRQEEEAQQGGGGRGRGRR